MCSECKNNFLMSVIEANSKEDALAQFRQEHIKFHLPVESKLIGEGELVGYWTYLQHLEKIESEFRRHFSCGEKSFDTLYIYTSNILKASGVYVIACVANRMGYACSSLSYMPGRRW